MFTGIVQTQACVLSAQCENNLTKLKISLPIPYIEQLTIGASVAVNGVCLTAVDFAEIDNNSAYISFDIIDKTLRVTNLRQIKQGDKLNVERSLKIGDEIGGHIVSGHIHCQAELMDIQKNAENCQLTLQCADQWMKYILAKGFITINGTSLTVGAISGDTFNVHLIPETLKITNLGQLSLGDKLNIELDQQTVTIVDTIERMQLKLS
ncbi:riboflavin synthase subunit alpha [Thalassotalea agariperforans]